MAHVGQKGALGLSSLFCDTPGLLRDLALLPQQMHGLGALGHKIGQQHKGYQRDGGDIDHEQRRDHPRRQIAAGIDKRLDQPADCQQHEVACEPQRRSPHFEHQQRAQRRHQRPQNDGAAVDESTQRDHQHERNQQQQQQLVEAQNLVAVEGKSENDSVEDRQQRVDPGADDRGGRATEHQIHRAPDDPRHSGKPGNRGHDPLVQTLIGVIAFVVDESLAAKHQRPKPRLFRHRIYLHELTRLVAGSMTARVAGSGHLPNRARIIPQHRFGC